jgi:HlyD family secretion protein
MFLDGTKPHHVLNMQNSPPASQVINSRLDKTDSKEKPGKLHRRFSGQSSVLIACLLGMGLITASCGSSPRESADAQSRPPGAGRPGGGATAVDVAIARTGTLQRQPEYTGTTIPFRTVSLRSQVEGRLLGMNVDVGDRVKQGQVIGQLDDALLLTAVKQEEAELAALQSEVARARTQVSNAQAAVERARLEVVQAQADSQRQQKLVKEGAISEQAAQQARTQAQTAAQALRAANDQVRTEQQAVSSAQGRVLAQQALVAQVKERRSYARLISPISGVITEKVTEPGNLLQAGGEVLRIGDFNRVKVVVQVSELELAQIKVGQSVQVRLDAFPNQTLTGNVIRISPAADATARLIPVEVVIPNNGGNIGSGLLARVNFTSQAAEQVVVPQTAIQKPGNNQAGAKQQSNNQTNNQNASLFVVTDAEGKAKVTARRVTLGKSIDGNVEILSGLKPGERYVARSARPLKDGDTVNLSIISEKVESSSEN